MIILVWNLKRYLFLLLVLMLLIGIAPKAYAAEPDTGSVVQEDTTEPAELPGDEVLSSTAAMIAAGYYAVMYIASTQNSIMLFDYADIVKNAFGASGVTRNDVRVSVNIRKCTHKSNT